MRRRALALVCGILAAPCGAEDQLHYYQDGDHVVITNTPTKESRPLRGVSAEPKQPGSSLPPTPYDAFIERLSAEYGLPSRLIKSVVMVESAFDPHAVSPKGARGLMQLMPDTAKQYGVRDAFDPLENLRAGTRHLRHLLDQFEGDLSLALAAYNAGASAVRRHGGIPDYRETVDYVRRVHNSMGRRSRQRPRPTPRSDPVRMMRDESGAVYLVN